MYVVKKGGGLCKGGGGGGGLCQVVCLGWVVENPFHLFTVSFCVLCWSRALTQRCCLYIHIYITQCVFCFCCAEDLEKGIKKGDTIGTGVRNVILLV